MGALWTDEARYGTWLAVEVAVTDALARRGLVPPDDLAAIHAGLPGAIDPARIAAIEAEVKHDVIAFVTSVAERIGGSAPPAGTCTSGSPPRTSWTPRSR
jgi:adenylosuccinate lyase